MNAQSQIRTVRICYLGIATEFRSEVAPCFFTFLETMINSPHNHGAEVVISIVDKVAPASVWVVARSHWWGIPLRPKLLTVLNIAKEGKKKLTILQVRPPPIQFPTSPLYILCQLSLALRTMCASHVGPCCCCYCCLSITSGYRDLPTACDSREVARALNRHRYSHTEDGGRS